MHRDDVSPQLYVPIAQNAWWLASLVVQPAGGPAAALAPTVRERWPAWTAIARYSSRH